MTRADLHAFVDSHRLAVLATVSSDGAPEAALVGFAITPELKMVFDTVSTSRKYANLQANPRCAFVIGCTTEVTVQYEGIATQPSGDELASYKQIYFAKWPDGPSRESWPNIAYFVVRPQWVRYSDFDQRPPLIEELDAEALRRFS